ncbi:MAG: hypothetical protein KIT48_13190 [Pseudolabrys sp.]|nr:hypothetical protein [Pseudolabrys sp.]
MNSTLVISICALLIAASGLGLNILLAVRSGQWGLSDRLSSMEGKIMAAVKEHRDAVDTAVDKSRAELNEKAETIRREFGETIKALQAKISDFEKWTRDTFVRRDSFLKVTDEVKQALTDRDASADKRFDRLEDKIDKLADHLLKK